MSLRPLREVATGFRTVAIAGAIGLTATLVAIGLAQVAFPPPSPADDSPAPRGVCLVSVQNRVQISPLGDSRATATNRWDKQELRIAFVDGEGSRYEALRSKIERSAKEWETFANVRFLFLGTAAKNADGDIIDKNLDIAIQLQETAFFRAGTYQSLNGPLAHEQTHALQPKRSMWLIFAPNERQDEVYRVTLHEFGHALGLIHEQTRPDLAIVWNRDAVIEFYQLFTHWDAEKITAQVMDPFRGQILATSPFDPTSIMIYPIPPGLANLEAAMPERLSPMDKLFIGNLYPFFKIPAPREISLDKPSEVEIVQPGATVCLRFTVPRDGDYEFRASGETAVLIGLPDRRDVSSRHGPAAEGKQASFVARLKSDEINPNGDKPGTQYLYLRHQQPRSGTGKSTVLVTYKGA